MRPWVGGERGGHSTAVEGEKVDRRKEREEGRRERNSELLCDPCR